MKTRQNKQHTKRGDWSYGTDSLTNAQDIEERIRLELERDMLTGCGDVHARKPKRRELLDVLMEESED